MSCDRVVDESEEFHEKNGFIVRVLRPGLPGILHGFAAAGCGGDDNESEFLRTAPPGILGEPEKVSERRARTRNQSKLEKKYEEKSRPPRKQRSQGAPRKRPRRVKSLRLPSRTILSRTHSRMIELQTGSIRAGCAVPSPGQSLQNHVILCIIFIQESRT